MRFHSIINDTNIKYISTAIQSVSNSLTVDVHLAEKNKQKIDEVIAKGEQSREAGKENITNRNENTISKTNNKSTYIISKFKQFFKS